MALAAVKRIREIVFVVWGFALGSIYSLRGLLKSAERGSENEDGEGNGQPSG